MKTRNRQYLSPIFATFGLISASAFAEVPSSFTCWDKSLKTPMIRIETEGTKSTLFNVRSGAIIDRELDCKFSKDARNLFMCSKAGENPLEVVEYFSQVETTDSLYESFAATAIYRVVWDYDVRKSNKMITSFLGSAAEMCQ